MKASEFDEKFAAGEDLTQVLDISRATRINQVQKRVNISFPVWMIQSLDREAQRLGVPRHSLIKLWISERLEAQS